MIYVVKSGDNLYSIAKHFGTNTATLTSINGLPDPDVLVVGQALVLPSTPSPDRPMIDTNLYVEWYTESPSQHVIDQVEKDAPGLTYMMPFAYEVLRDGSLTSMNWGKLGEVAKNHQVESVIVLANIENGAFNDTLAHTIFTDDQVKQRVFENAVAEATVKGATHIHTDFEYIAKEDRKNYVTFLKELKEFAKGFTISSSLAPKSSDNLKGKWYEGIDYKAIGEVVDFVVIMTYEWGYSGGPPMAVSPIGPVRKVLEYAKTEIESKKIMMGQNLYGYDWTLPYKQGNAFAKALSPQRAIQLARERNAAIEYDPIAQAPFFHYWKDGIEHEVWFEDARSIQAKFKLLKELNLLGISYWHSGFDFPQNWYLLNEMFRVKKK
ncbi:LysM peptidoglycan-binding domain-containing protein [Psychrobacillus glaciei]|uniref:LysM peptidoglycan-binding domain-containing protein n=1 Tax=Psychrobacillus glaciei TaxID=2283160 RepID=A0A5J6SHK9_9BACI|nr:glycosyl hydrolase family 18 protein [Psychrobacillus glaciei]QFF97360.1 LysM peptidoglycan-binding domain-containing protein [Psychrobacillus glaciei]